MQKLFEGNQLEPYKDQHRLIQKSETHLFPLSSILFKNQFGYFYIFIYLVDSRKTTGNQEKEMGNDVNQGPQQETNRRRSCSAT